MQETVSAKAETALLVGIQYDGQSQSDARLLLNELSSLVDTMGLKVLDAVTAPVKKINPRYLTGSGKVSEISAAAAELEADCIIFDCDISPSQQRNWEELTDRCVIDRQEVILDIFADRAVTREAMLQVGLARMEYSLPRLTRAWTHLSRQRGGTRGTRGEGETQLEVDRRIVTGKINKIKNELKKVEKERHTQRKRRNNTQIPLVSIIGYTNAGKSSLLNAMTRSEVLVEDRLFATLDSVTRKMKLSGGTDILLSDTVGFIRNLPHGLVEAFKSTLEEVLYADIILHVVDISNPEFREHIKTTNSVLAELGAEKKRQMLVFNKTDLNNEYPNLLDQYENSVAVSVKNGRGLELLADRLQEMIFHGKKEITVSIPASRGDLKALLHRSAYIISEEINDEKLIIRAAVSPQIHSQLKEFSS